MGSLKRKVNQLNPPGTQGTLWAYYPRTRGPKPILGQQGGPNHKAVNLLSFSYSLRLVRGYKQTSTQCTNLHFLTICRAISNHLLPNDSTCLDDSSKSTWLIDSSELTLLIFLCDTNFAQDFKSKHYCKFFAVKQKKRERDEKLSVLLLE